jgi:hypothetical protein
MATLPIEPTNKSFLSNNKFDFVIDRLPNIQFFIQTINLPTISLGIATTPTPFVTVQTPGTIITFEEITVSYIIDEDMKSWFEIYNWLHALAGTEGFPKSTLKNSPGSYENFTSSATLIIKTNSNNANVKLKFFDLFPTNLTGFQLSATESHDFITSTVTFNYTKYEADYI